MWIAIFSFDHCYSNFLTYSQTKVKNRPPNRIHFLYIQVRLCPACAVRVIHINIDILTHKSTHRIYYTYRNSDSIDMWYFGFLVTYGNECSAVWISCSRRVSSITHKKVFQWYWWAQKFMYMPMVMHELQNVRSICADKYIIVKEGRKAER